jgi:adenosine/AMP kinase
VVLAPSARGRGILGVVGGFARKVVEDKAWIERRRDFLRQVGYQQ